MKTSSKYLAFAFVTFLGMGASAQAQMLTFPASGCSIQSGTASFNDRGEVWNYSSTTTLKLLCPITRLDQNDNFKGDVFVIDRHASSSVTCTPYVNNVGGWTAGTAKSSSGSSSTYQTLSFTDPTYGYSFTSRYYICTVPPTYNGASSGVLLYRGETF